MISLSPSEDEGEGEANDEPLPSSPDESPKRDDASAVLKARRERRAGLKKDEKKEDEKAWIPQRVTDVLKESKTFSECREKRVFQFLHLFSGDQDVLGQAIVEVAQRESLRVGITSIDRDGKRKFDLAADQPFGDIMDHIRGGLYDGAHAGFPCSSFSMVRYRPGGPLPVRSLAHIYGLPTNNDQHGSAAEGGGQGDGFGLSISTSNWRTSAIPKTEASS